MFILTQEKEAIIQPSNIYLEYEDILVMNDGKTIETKQVIMIMNRVNKGSITLLGTYGEFNEAFKTLQNIFIAIKHNECFEMPVSHTMQKKTEDEVW